MSMTGGHCRRKPRTDFEANAANGGPNRPPFCMRGLGMTELSWIVELDVLPGRLAALRKLMKEMVSSARRKEPGTTAFEWFIAENGRTCHIYERYVDSKAALVHVETFGKAFAPRFLACVKPTRIV